jgi:outer membrane protein TolC
MSRVTPDPLREGVREGILGALAEDRVRSGPPLARRLAAAGVAGLVGAVALTLLFAGDRTETEDGRRLAVCGALWSALLVVSFAFLLLRIRTERIRLDRAAALGLVGLALAATTMLLWHRPHVGRWWHSTALGAIAHGIAGDGGSLLCFGLCSALVLGFTATLLLMARGSRVEDALAPAASLAMLLGPVVLLQGAGASVPVLTAWGAGIALGSYVGVRLAAALTRRRHVRTASVLLGGALVLAAPARVAAQPAAGTTRPLTLAWALDQARSKNPALQAAQARYLALRERPRREGSLPDPMLGVRYHNEDWNLTLGESDFSFVEVAAEQEIPFPGKLALRERVALREAERERAMRDATAAMVLGAVAARFTDLAVAETSGGILRENLGVLDLMVEQSSARYEVGEAEQQDVLRAAQERSGLQERLTMLERQRAAARAALASLLDLAREADLPALGSLEEPPPLAPLEVLQAKLAERSPELRAAQEELLRAGEELRLARREYFPDFSVMAAYMDKDRLLPEWELGVRVTVPLYFWRKQRAAVAEATLAERAAERGRRNTELDLAARLADAHAMAQAARRLVALYGGTLIPQAEATLESARASYAVGRVDSLTTLTAFASLLEYRLREVEERGRLWRALTEIGPLVGETPLGEPIASAP